MRKNYLNPLIIQKITFSVQKNAKKSWWKFWVKKAAFPCQKAETIEEIEG